MRHAPLEGFSAAPFEHRLRTPFRSGRGLIEVRRGYFIRLESDGATGYGEVSPLPGFHAESLDEAMRGLVEALRAGGCPVAPSAAFGLSCAEAMVDAELSDRFNLVTPAREPLVRVNALFDGTAEEAAAVIKSGRFTGYRTIKVKIGRVSLEGDVALVKVLRSKLKSTQRIRLDANRLLDFDAAVELLGTIGPEKIEFVEEPLARPELLPELARRTGIPMAIDETLREADIVDDVLGAEGVTVQVVKPSLMGRLEELEAIITRGTINGCDTVFSNLFESSFTLTLLGRVAAVLGSVDRDHGLATADLFDSDCCPRPMIEGGRMLLDQALPTPQLAWVPLDAVVSGA
ncbi:MAG: o-succinylbenzoate synthase [Planctomycetota bacterium]|nr:o-succinylbenzoate synthase [Planctomycetota bacterium]